jgi:hypothetical protein
MPKHTQVYIQKNSSKVVSCQFHFSEHSSLSIGTKFVDTNLFGHIVSGYVTANIYIYIYIYICLHHIFLYHIILLIQNQIIMMRPIISHYITRSPLI